MEKGSSPFLLTTELCGKEERDDEALHDMPLLFNPKWEHPIDISVGQPVIHEVFQQMKSTRNSAP